MKRKKKKNIEDYRTRKRIKRASQAMRIGAGNYIIHRLYEMGNDLHEMSGQPGEWDEFSDGIVYPYLPMKFEIEDGKLFVIWKVSSYTYSKIDYFQSKIIEKAERTRESGFVKTLKIRIPLGKRINLLELFRFKIMKLVNEEEEKQRREEAQDDI